MEPKTKLIYLERKKEKYKELYRDKQINRNRLIRYGISTNDYEQLLKEQDFRCAICKRHLSEFKKAFSIDHCHETKTIRGLLCNPCNQSLGLLQDDPERLERAAEYLRANRET